MLQKGSVRSCGCLRRETCVSAPTKHGASKHGFVMAEYSTLRGIIQRCENKRSLHFDKYGGRGIRVCDRWRESFENFLADMGPKPTPKHSLDRIDVNGHYEPGNCRWATQTEQMRNTRSNRRLTFRGETLPMSEWAERLELDPSLVRARVDRLGWTVERALTEPAAKQRFDTVRPSRRFNLLSEAA